MEFPETECAGGCAEWMPNMWVSVALSPLATMNEGRGGECYISDCLRKCMNTR